MRQLIKHKCGHSITFDLKGNGVARFHRKVWLESQDCRNCALKAQGFRPEVTPYTKQEKHDWIRSRMLKAAEAAVNAFETNKLPTLDPIKGSKQLRRLRNALVYLQNINDPVWWLVHESTPVHELLILADAEVRKDGKKPE